MNSPSTPTPAPPRPSLLKTPLRDLIRGRVTGRLDVPARIAPLHLPPEVEDRCIRIARHTRFKRIPRADLAVSLCDHAAMQIEAGWTPEEVLADLGDPKQRGREIRRQARAKRTLGRRLFDAMRAAAAVGIVLSLISYAYAFARFHLSHPVINRNMAQELSASWTVTPEDQRAAPLYKRAIAAMPSSAGDQPPKRWPEAAPADPEWDEFKVYVQRYQPSLAMARAASEVRVLGLHLSDGVDTGWAQPAPDHAAPTPGTENPPVIAITLPHLGKLRQFGRLAAADARLAAAEGDAARVEADLLALLRFASHAREVPIEICDMVGLSLLEMQLAAVGEIVHRYPGLLNDAQLLRLASANAAFPGDGPLTLRLSGDELFVEDVLQRCFSDDGTGDGRLCAQGLRNWDTMMDMSGGFPVGTSFLAPVRAMRVASRKEMKAEWGSVRALMEAEVRNLPWQRVGSQWEERQEQFDRDPSLHRKFYFVEILMPGFEKARAAFDHARVWRDGTLIAIALERYRLANGHWPESLAHLEPRFLTALPADPFDGKPFKYILRPEGPLVYSIGADENDDGGVPPPGRMGNVGASRWQRNVQNAPNGDFVAWPIPPEPKRASEEEEGGG